MRAAAVRYASVRIWLRPRTGAEIATDGGGVSGYADRPPGLAPLTWHLGCLLDVVVSLVAGFGWGWESWVPRASVIRLFAASACPSMQWA